MSTSSSPSNAVDITTLPTQQLSQLQQRISSEFEHLTTSHTKLRSAQLRFRECIKNIESGVVNAPKDQDILVPLTGSLYIPGKLADREKVIVDVGTGFFVEKTTTEATKFYQSKIDEIGKNLNDLEKIIQGKSDNLRVVEEVLRQKVLSSQGNPHAAS